MLFPSSVSPHSSLKAPVVGARYFRGLVAVGIPALGHSKWKRCSPPETLREFGEFALADKIEEIFVARHAIAHAHLWKAKVDQIDLIHRAAHPPAWLR
jgi:hypothetical protein